MDRSAGRFQVSDLSSLARAAHIIGLSHLTLVLVCVAWRFASAGSSCHNDFSVFSSLTTIVVRHPVYFVVARICPKAIRKAPTLSVVLRPYALCYFLYLPLLIPSPLSAPSFCHPRRHSSYHCRKDSTANIRPALLLHLWRSERPFSQRYPLQFCDLSVYTPAPRYFLWSISIKKNTAITRPTPSGRPCDQPPTKTAYRIARPTCYRRPRSQSRQVW
jgi:hypothetical protein